MALIMSEYKKCVEINRRDVKMLRDIGESDEEGGKKNINVDLSRRVVLKLMIVRDAENISKQMTCSKDFAHAIEGFDISLNPHRSSNSTKTSTESSNNVNSEYDKIFF